MGMNRKLLILIKGVVEKFVKFIIPSPVISTGDGNEILAEI